MNKIIERDVIVVGAGPEDSTCATYLAREGVDVLLMDRETFPRDSQAEVTMEHVKELGAYEEVKRQDTVIKVFCLHLLITVKHIWMHLEKLPRWLQTQHLMH